MAHLEVRVAKHHCKESYVPPALQPTHLSPCVQTDFGNTLPSHAFQDTAFVNESNRIFSLQRGRPTAFRHLQLKGYSLEAEQKDKGPKGLFLVLEH